MKVLKNLSRKRVETIFRGRKITFMPKHSMVLEENEEGIALARHLLGTYGFIIDRTALFEKKEVKKIDK